MSAAVSPRLDVGHSQVPKLTPLDTVPKVRHNSRRSGDRKTGEVEAVKAEIDGLGPTIELGVERCSPKCRGGDLVRRAREPSKPAPGDDGKPS